MRVGKGKVLVTQSGLTLCNPMDLACQGPLSMEFFKQINEKKKKKNNRVSDKTKIILN